MTYYLFSCDALQFKGEFDEMVDSKWTDTPMSQKLSRV